MRQEQVRLYQSRPFLTFFAPLLCLFPLPLLSSPLFFHLLLVQQQQQQPSNQVQQQSLKVPFALRIGLLPLSSTQPVLRDTVATVHTNNNE